jgi:DNA-binding beta-propeller fold protein YncE
MMSRKIVLVILIILVSFQIGCVARLPEQVDIFWPPYPDEPRIAYVRNIETVPDIEGASFFDRLLGSTNARLFLMPYGVSFFGDKIYVADPDSHAVVILYLNQRKMKDIMSTENVDIKTPIGVTVGADGTVFVADAAQGKVLLFSGDGDYITAIGKKGEMRNPTGVAVNNALGRVYITDSFSDTVHVYSLGGERLFTFGKPGSGEGEFHHPTNIALDRRNSNVVVTDTSNFRVQVFDKDGKFLMTFGKLGDDFGTFSRPKGIGVDSEGNIYVADAAFGNIQVFSPEGALLTAIAGPGTSPGSLQLPAGLYVDANDRIYVADQRNSRVQVFQYMSEKWKKEHSDEYGKYLQKSAAEAEKASRVTKQQAGGKEDLRTDKRDKD